MLPPCGAIAVLVVLGELVVRKAIGNRIAADRPEVTKHPDFTHKRTNHELRRSCGRHRARP